MKIINNLKITDTAYGGYGVGRDSGGQVIFVYGAVEGDICSVELTDTRKNFAYGRVVEIIKPSPFRIRPACSRANKCGGCSFAHIDYESQINIKCKIIKNAFRKVPDIPEILVHKSPSLNYRIRAAVKAKSGAIGFSGFKSNEFVSVKNCPVVKESLFVKIKVMCDNYYNNVIMV